MSNDKYNGWTNYETWLVNIELLDGASAKDIWGKQCKPDWVETYVKDVGRRLSEGFDLSCVNTVLSEVNWHELAEHLNED